MVYVYVCMHICIYVHISKHICIESYLCNKIIVYIYTIIRGFAKSDPLITLEPTQNTHQQKKHGFATGETFQGSFFPNKLPKKLPLQKHRSSLFGTKTPPFRIKTFLEQVAYP